MYNSMFVPCYSTSVHYNVQYVCQGRLQYTCVQTCRIQTKHITTHHAGMYSLKINYISHNCVVPEDDYNIHIVLHYMLLLYYIICIRMSMPHTYMYIILYVFSYS